MVKVVGVRFKSAGKVYYFDPCEFEIEIGTSVIVETARGMEFGVVSAAPKEVDESDYVDMLDFEDLGSVSDLDDDDDLDSFEDEQY